MRTTRNRPRPRRPLSRDGALAQSLMADLRESHVRERELTRQRDDAVDAYQAKVKQLEKLEREMSTFTRNYEAVLAENRRLHERVKEPVGLAYNRKTDEVECGGCGWTLEEEVNYCPNCGHRIDADCAEDDEGWRYDAWKERWL